MGTIAVDDFNTGTRSALVGGTTTFIDFVIPGKGVSLETAYEDWRKRADSKVNCDYALHAAIIEWDDSTFK